MRISLLTALLALALAAPASAQLSALRVPIDATRTRDEATLRADHAVRLAARNALDLTQRARARKAAAGAFHTGVPLLIPQTVRLTIGGKELAPPAATTRSLSAALTLVFEAEGERAFPPEYRQFLQDVFASARPTIDLVFGQPSVGGTVRVANFDADIGDRQAVAGGYFMPNNGAGQQEIRFAVYSNPEAAAVNFVHTLLLAYMGTTPYAFDPYYEGLARAATARIVRTPGALPAGLDPAEVERVLANSYEVGPYYDWTNQRGLAGPRFIAPNLLTAPLPAGGSVGGLYLLRHRMAGSAWHKVLAQYPSFISRLNARLYAQPSIGASPPALIQAGQAVLNEIAGAGATVEGLSFAQWVKRQYVLQPYLTRGDKLVVEPTPITSGLSGGDFGVFLLEIHYFRTTGASGHETLLSGTSYPIFWEGEGFLNRLFPSAQEDRVDLAGAYGSVVPNLPNLHDSQPYRAVADVPVNDQLERVYLPAGAVATATNQTENTLFGTVIGATGTLRVRATIGATVVADVPVTRGAFGARVTAPLFLGTASVLIDVLQGDTLLLRRRVNKTPGALALDLRVGGEATFVFSLPKGMSTVGMPLDPWQVHIPAALGLTTPQTLVARFNPARATYDLYPELEPFKIGHGYFVRMPEARSATLDGRTHPRMAMSVALRPGWNLIANPLLEAVPTTRVRVVQAASFPQDWTEAVGAEVGAEFFRFVPGPTDPASGAAETGSFVAATEFQPGQAYYVRVLAPEGVTLLFERAAAAATATRAAAAAPVGWSVAAQLVAPNRTALAHFGQSTAATVGFDPRLESPLPPSMGGLQVAVDTGARMYRDVRPYATAQTYRLRLEGLVAGQNYTLRLTATTGSPPALTVYDPGTGFVRVARAPTAYSFVAQGPQKTLEVSVK